MHIIQELSTSMLAQKFHFTQLEANVVLAARPVLATSKNFYRSTQYKTESLKLTDCGSYKQSKGHHLSWDYFDCEKIVCYQSVFQKTSLQNNEKLSKLCEMLLLLLYDYFALFFYLFPMEAKVILRFLCIPERYRNSQLISAKSDSVKPAKDTKLLQISGGACLRVPVSEKTAM